MIVRMTNRYRGLAPLPAYGHHIIFSVHLRDPRPDGFPSSEDGDALASLEEKLCGLLEPGIDRLCVLVVTNNGLRDFIFYTRDAEAMKMKIEASGKILLGFETEIAIEPDGNWEIYRTFCGMLGGAGPAEGA